MLGSMRENAEQLVEALASEAWPTRTEAIAGLRALGDRAAPALAAGAEHRDARARAESVALMDHLADARCVDALLAALGDPSARVRRHAVHSIGCQRCKLAPLDVDVVGLLIENAMNDRSARVRQVAAHQLGLQPHDPRAVAALATILRTTTDEKLRSRAEFALSQQCDRA